MMVDFGSCESRTSDPLIVFKENRNRIVFRNANRRSVRRVVIDDCVITEGLRCDYLLISSNDVEHYIELKGCSVRHAVAQIAETIKQVSADAKHCGKHSFVISSRCPLMSTEIQQMKKNFRQQYASTLTIKNREHTVEI